jgi:hypothetical protein
MKCHGCAAWAVGAKGNSVLLQRSRRILGQLKPSFSADEGSILKFTAALGQIIGDLLGLEFISKHPRHPGSRAF